MKRNDLKIIGSTQTQRPPPGPYPPTRPRPPTCLLVNETLWSVGAPGTDPVLYRSRRDYDHQKDRGDVICPLEYWNRSTHTRTPEPALPRSRLGSYSTPDTLGEVRVPLVYYVGKETEGTQAQFRRRPETGRTTE